MIEFNKREFRAWSIMGINPSIWSVAFPEILENAENITDIAVLSADLARYSGMLRTMRQHSDIFYNTGIAEQNMVGIGAGFAFEGKTVYMTTYAPFMTFRCADQVRCFMGNMNLNIKAIGSAAGFAAGASSPHLTSLSDIALMRSIPNITVMAPADCAEAVKMMLAISKVPGPVYIRTGDAVNVPMVYDVDYEFEVGKVIQLAEGAKVAIVASGTTIVPEAMKAAKLMKEKYGVMPSVFNMHTIKPIDKDCLDGICTEYSLIVTVEEHSVVGGLGSTVAEYLSTKQEHIRQIYIGAQDRLYTPGTRRFMLEQCGLTAEGIVDRVAKEIQL